MTHRRLACIKNGSFILILVILSGCRIAHLGSLTPDRKTPITIQTDGYFCTSVIHRVPGVLPDKEISEQTFLRPIFLYKDNSCLLSGDFSSFEGIDNYATNDRYKESIKSRTGWGYFYINDDAITIQITDLDQSGFVGSVIAVRKMTGQVVNDSTLQFGPVTYKFKHGPKPDSSNWVKDKLAKRHKK